MCGIVYGMSFLDKPINDKILEQFQKQKSRGTQGFGLYDRPYSNIVKTPKQHKIEKWLRKHPSSEILFHHRFPTSTENVTNACHPFSTREYFADTNYVLVHNGVIWNSDKLKKSHEDFGIVYSSIQPDGSFNDSEALLWDFALTMEGWQDELQAEGNIALICMAISEKKGDQLYFARNDNPLNLDLQDGDYIFLSSEGAGEPIERQTLYTWDYKEAALTQKPFRVPSYQYNWKTSQGSGDYTGYKGGYDWDDEFDWERLGSNPVNTYDESEEEDDFLPQLALDGLQYTEDVESRKRDIQERYSNYMKWAEGYISLAYEMMGEDLHYIKLHFDDLKLDGEDTEDIEYEIEVHEAAMAIIKMNPFWKHQESRDPVFDKKDEPDMAIIVAEEIVKDVVAKRQEQQSQKQTTILLPNNTHTSMTYQIPGGARVVNNTIVNHGADKLGDLINKRLQVKGA